MKHSTERRRKLIGKWRERQENFLTDCDDIDLKQECQDRDIALVEWLCEDDVRDLCDEHGIKMVDMDVTWTLDDLAEIVRLSARLVYTSSPSERDATVAEIRHLLSSRLNVTNGRVADFELML